jgi:hypothetical protein
MDGRSAISGVHPVFLAQKNDRTYDTNYFVWYTPSQPLCLLLFGDYIWKTHSPCRSICLFRFQNGSKRWWVRPLESWLATSTLHRSIPPLRPELPQSVSSVNDLPPLFLTLISLCNSSFNPCSSPSFAVGSCVELSDFICLYPRLMRMDLLSQFTSWLEIF